MSDQHAPGVVAPPPPPPSRRQVRPAGPRGPLGALRRWRGTLTSEQLGRRAVAVVLALMGVLMVGLIVGELTGRDPRAGSGVTASTPEPTPTGPAPGDVVAGPDNTGVPEGTRLVSHDANTIERSDVLLVGIHVEGDLEIDGSNVTLRNSRIEGNLVIRGAGVVVEDSELGALAVSGGTDVTVRRVEVFGSPGSDGIHVTSGDGARTSDVVIEGCWIHSPNVLPESHYDGIQVRGVDRLTLRGNTFDLGRWMDRHNAAIFLEDANGGNADVLIERNLVNGGGYMLYLFGTDVRLVDNAFGEDFNWGLLYPEYLPFEETGSRWASDGSPLSVTDPLR